jgi:hypothetical protein
MESFKEFLLNEEEKKIEKQINEGAAEFIGSALGYGAVGMAAAFGGSLLAYAGVKGVKGLVNLWKKIIKTAKSIKSGEEVVKEVRTDAKVKKVKDEIEQKAGRWDEELKNIYIAIAAKDFEKAKEEFQELDKSIQNNLDVQKAIIAAIVKELKMPPIYIQSPGNKSYQAIKKIINIRVARAAAEATKMAMEQNLETDE